MEYLKATLNITAFNRFDDLIALSFVEPFENKGYNIHERSRKLLEKHLWDEKPEYYRQLSLHAYTYCSAQDLEDTSWMIEYISHMLVAKPEKGPGEFDSICIKWFNPPLFAYDKIAAKIHYEQALQIYREIGDKLGEANTLKAQGDVERMQAQYDAAKTHYELALDIYHNINIRSGESDCVFAFGELLRAQGRWHEATNKYKKALDFYREKGLRSEQAFVLWQLGMAAQGTGNNELAMTYLKEALSIYKVIKGPKLQKVQEVIDALDKGIPYDAKHQFE